MFGGKRIQEKKEQKLEEERETKGNRILQKQQSVRDSAQRWDPISSSQGPQASPQLTEDRRGRSCGTRSCDPSPPTARPLPRGLSAPAPVRPGAGLPAELRSRQKRGREPRQGTSRRQMNQAPAAGRGEQPRPTPPAPRVAQARQSGVSGSRGSEQRGLTNPARNGGAKWTGKH